MQNCEDLENLPGYSSFRTVKEVICAAGRFHVGQEMAKEQRALNRHAWLRNSSQAEASGACNARTDSDIEHPYLHPNTAEFQHLALKSDSIVDGASGHTIDDLLESYRTELGSAIDFPSNLVTTAQRVAWSDEEHQELVYAGGDLDQSLAEVDLLTDFAKYMVAEVEDEIQEMEMEMAEYYEQLEERGISEALYDDMLVVGGVDLDYDPEEMLADIEQRRKYFDMDQLAARYVRFLVYETRAHHLGLL